jgi:putative ABC transport system permease protein
VGVLRETGFVTLMNLRNVPSRLGSSLVIIVGIAGVVGVLVSLLAMSVGVANTVANTGRPDRAIVMHSGAVSEFSSSLTREETLTIMDAPGIVHGADGKPVASADVVMALEIARARGRSTANVTLRGVGPRNGALRPEMRLVAGRIFQPGLHELIAGKSAQAEFTGLAIGDRIKMRNADWTIVGVFASDNAQDSEVVGDADSLVSAFQRNLFQDVTALLETPEAFERFRQALISNPTLAVEAEREQDYYRSQTKFLTDTLFSISYLVGAIMAVGAVFGAINTMYSAVSARAVEIATLRAIGFGAGVVVTSVFVEALLLALTGAVIATALAWLIFNGSTVSLMSLGPTQLVVPLTVTPALMAQGVLCACVIGLLGGLFPAIRAARLPVAEALRAL